jgi:hypothetical protein
VAGSWPEPPVRLNVVFPEQKWPERLGGERKLLRHKRNARTDTADRVVDGSGESRAESQSGAMGSPGHTAM